MHANITIDVKLRNSRIFKQANTTPDFKLSLLEEQSIHDLNVTLAYLVFYVSLVTLQIRYSSPQR